MGLAGNQRALTASNDGNAAKVTKIDNESPRCLPATNGSKETFEAISNVNSSEHRSRYVSTTAFLSISN